MKSIITILVTTLLAAVVTSGSAATLDRISKSQSRDAVQIFFSLSGVPQWDQKRSERRLDVILHDTVPAETLSVFDQDETIVKILTMVEADATVVSFFFRYPPQKIDFAISDNRTLVIDLLPGNRFRRPFEELIERLSEVTLLDRPLEDYSNPVLSSPFVANWRSFFSAYETPVTITAPVAFTIPDFPTIRFILPSYRAPVDYLGEQMLDLGHRESWAELLGVIEPALHTVTDLETAKMLALTHGEVLFRLRNFEGAYKQLYLLRQSYPDDQVGLLATYLLALLLAVHDDPYTADYTLRSIAEKLPAGHPLAPHHVISVAETGLATGQYRQVRQSLDRNDVAYPPPLLTIRQLRHADLLHAEQRPIQAFVAYRLLAENLDLQQYPASLNAYCATLYEQRMWQQSGDCYRALSTLIADRAELGMSYFRTVMARLKQGEPPAALRAELARIEDTFPNTEAGFRAALKNTDLRYLADDAWHLQAKEIYRALADNADYRGVAEEAYFKEALLYHLHGDDAAALSRLMTLLRRFRSGPIIVNAEALLLQMLPGEIRRLIDAGDHLDALVLARQNRRFFDNNWLEPNLLVDLAIAYERLGIYQEALDLYIYLISIADNAAKERYYLPLMRVALAKGDYMLVADLANQYQYNFPDGPSREQILLLRLQALYATDRLDEAVSVLPDPLPNHPEFTRLAAILFFNTGAYERVIDLLQPQTRTGAGLSDAHSFMLGESLFNVGRLGEAIAHLQAGSAAGEHHGQALYRLAQISRNQGNEREALNIFTQLAETTDDSLWKELAQRELNLRRIIRN